MSNLFKNTLVPSVLLLITLYASNTQAHLMVAQHGTLNIVDDGIYLVLSLPVSAFENIDDNNDKSLSQDEFTVHKNDIAQEVRNKIILSDESDSLKLNGLMLSPLTPHDGAPYDGTQIIIMGKFERHNKQSQLKFELGLFGNIGAEQNIEITVSDKAKGLKQVIHFSPQHAVSNLLKS